MDVCSVYRIPIICMHYIKLCAHFNLCRKKRKRNRRQHHKTLNILYTPDGNEVHSKRKKKINKKVISYLGEELNSLILQEIIALP